MLELLTPEAIAEAEAAFKESKTVEIFGQRFYVRAFTVRTAGQTLDGRPIGRRGEVDLCPAIF